MGSEGSWDAMAEGNVPAFGKLNNAIWLHYYRNWMAFSRPRGKLHFQPAPTVPQRHGLASRAKVLRNFATLGAATAMQ